MNPQFRLVVGAVWLQGLGATSLSAFASDSDCTADIATLSAMCQQGR
jgi:hypothetical protein